jgi:hypothetical protein
MSKKNKKPVTKPATVELDEDNEQNDAIIGVAIKWSLGVAILLGLIGLGAWAAVSIDRTPKERTPLVVTLPEQRSQVAVTIPKIPLVDITASAGIDFQHFNGMDGEKLLPETMGGGVAFFDYDNDSDQDLLFVNGAPWAWSKKEVNPLPTLILFANDGKGNFTNVTKDVGLDVTLHGMGPAVGDFDNDGWTDLFITAIGTNRLFRNNQGKFVDVTAQAGVAGGETDWSSGCTFFDYDNDGLLDLFVCNYVQWSREIDLAQEFSLVGIGRAYGPPAFFKGTYANLYHNEGNGTFTDVSEKCGIRINNPATGVPMAKALGIAPIDVDRDGWQDIVIANDTVANFLFLNQKDGTFREAAVPSSLAFDRNGNATGAMGLDCAYMRNDETLAIAIGNFSNEPSSLYLSRGKQAIFFDAATATGLGPLTRLSLTFGMFFADLDLDGRLDLACTNGQLEPEISTVSNTQRYEQPPQLFWNAGVGGGTELVPLTAEQIGPDALKPMVGRGAAYADIDSDGDIDMVFIANGGKPRLLRNDQSVGNHWLRVALKQKDKNLAGLGSEIHLTVKRGDKSLVQTRCITPTRSYLSQCELTATFGVAKDAQIEKLEVHWPDGQVQTLTDVKLDQLLTVQRNP